MASSSPASVLEGVVPHHLCCGCGLCVGVCPTRALAMGETPAGYLWAQATDTSRCTGCGLCLRVCPGRGVAGAAPADDPFLGPLRAIHTAWANDPAVCHHGTSGGVVTALLATLLARGAIAAALVTRWNPQDPLRPEAFWARTAEEVFQAQKSKYCMVPIGERFAREELAALPEDARLAVVGLPCHLEGLHQAGGLPLAARLVLRIGLFCDRTLSRHVIDHLVRRAGVAPAAVEAFEYRHKGRRGWPGEVYVKPEGGPPVFVDRAVRMGLKEAYTPLRCRLCFDKLNVFADLACGDGYGAAPRAEGVSVLLVRTAAGEAALATAGDALCLTPFATETLRQMQGLSARQHALAAATAAYEAMHPGREAPLPGFCRPALPAVAADAVAHATSTLRAAWAFEAAPTRALADQLAQDLLRASRPQRWRAWLRRAFGRLGRLAAKGRFPSRRPGGGRTPDEAQHTGN